MRLGIARGGRMSGGTAGARVVVETETDNKTLNHISSKNFLNKEVDIRGTFLHL